MKPLIGTSKNKKKIIDGYFNNDKDKRNLKKQKLTKLQKRNKSKDNKGYNV